MAEMLDPKTLPAGEWEQLQALSRKLVESFAAMNDWSMTGLQQYPKVIRLLQGATPEQKAALYLMSLHVPPDAMAVWLSPALGSMDELHKLVRECEQLRQQMVKAMRLAEAGTMRASLN